MLKHLLILATTATLSLASIYDAGEYNVGELQILPDGYDDLTHKLNVYAPSQGGESFTLVLFETGMVSKVSATHYSNLLTRIATHGYAVVGVSNPSRGTDATEFDGHGVEEVMDFVQANLVRIMTENGFPSDFDIDFNSIYMMGHSSGNHIIVGYLDNNCNENIKGLIMVSPVDGGDPYGLTDSCITPGELLPFSLPSLILSTGYDSVSGHPEMPLWPVCAPSELSNRRFYDAISGDVWMLNATDFGHFDLLNPALVQLNNKAMLCGTSGPTVEESQGYTDYIAGQVIAFIKGIKGEDCSLLEYLENPSLLPEDIQVTMEMKGSGMGACGQSGCSYL